jgi:hypothetical protein
MAQQYPNRLRRERHSPNALGKQAVHRGHTYQRQVLAALESITIATRQTHLLAAQEAVYDPQLEEPVCDKHRLCDNRQRPSSHPLKPRKSQKPELWARAKVQQSFLLPRQKATKSRCGKRERQEICVNTIKRTIPGFNILGRTPTAMGVERAPSASVMRSLTSLLLLFVKSQLTTTLSAMPL